MEVFKDDSSRGNKFHHASVVHLGHKCSLLGMVKVSTLDTIRGDVSLFFFPSCLIYIHRLTLYQHFFRSIAVPLRLPSMVNVALLSFIFMMDTCTCGKTLQNTSLVFQRTYKVTLSTGHIQIPITRDRWWFLINALQASFCNLHKYLVHPWHSRWWNTRLGSIENRPKPRSKLLRGLFYWTVKEPFL